MKNSASALFIRSVIITIINLALSSLWTVNGDGVAVTEVFVPLRVCQKAIYLIEVELDDGLTDEIINSLISVDQPFELHPNPRGYLRAKRFDELNLIVRFTCLAHIVLVQDGPVLRTVSMNLLLKRFNRKRGNENDFVLVFAPLEDRLNEWDWRRGITKRLMPRNFPDNALLIELDECAQDEYAQRRRCVSGVYTFQLYCDEEEEVCWRPQSAVGLFFPKLKADFDAEFMRVRSNWRYNYNNWHITFNDEIFVRGDFDDLANMTFRLVTWGRYTWDDYMADDYYTLLTPTVWMALEIVRHLNATLLPKSWVNVLELGTEIRMQSLLLIDQVLALRPESRNVHLQYGYIKFAYCTNGTGLRESANISAIFKPFEFICWILLGLVVMCTAVLSRVAGREFQILQVIGCLGCQGIGVSSKHRLAMMFVLWQAVAFLVSNFYCAFIESILAAPDLLPRIQSFKELDQSCEVPWLPDRLQYFLRDRVSSVRHLKALMERSKSMGTDSILEPELFRAMVEYEKQCLILQSSIEDPWWTEMVEIWKPGVTCTEGNEKLIGDPLMWHILAPNAAILYRTVRALETTGILLKFRKYQDSRQAQQRHHFMLHLKSAKLDTSQMDVSDSSESTNVLSMSNGQVQALFASYLAVNGFGFCVFVIEYGLLFAYILCVLRVYF